MPDPEDRKFVLTDEQWERIAPHLPKRTKDNWVGRGRPWGDHRTVIEGIIYRFRSGCPWRDVPADYGVWQTIYDRFNTWSKDGIFNTILSEPTPTAATTWSGSCPSTQAMPAPTSTPPAPSRSQPSTPGRTPQRRSRTQGARSNYKNPPTEPADHGLGRSRGGWTTKIHLAVDKTGRPLAIRLTPGQAGDNPELIPLLDDIDVPVRDSAAPTDRSRPDTVVADKAYSHPSTRKALRRRGIKACIPERRDQIEHRQKKGSAGGRPPAFDAEVYRGRNVVERAFNKMKEWRGIGTRYDKLAVTYLGGVVLSAIVRCWLR